MQLRALVLVDFRNLPRDRTEVSLFELRTRGRFLQEVRHTRVATSSASPPSSSASTLADPAEPVIGTVGFFRDSPGTDLPGRGRLGT